MVHSAHGLPTIATVSPAAIRYSRASPHASAPTRAASSRHVVSRQMPSSLARNATRSGRVRARSTSKPGNVLARNVWKSMPGGLYLVALSSHLVAALLHATLKRLADLILRLPRRRPDPEARSDEPSDDGPGWDGSRGVQSRRSRIVRCRTRAAEAGQSSDKCSGNRPDDGAGKRRAKPRAGRIGVAGALLGFRHALRLVSRDPSRVLILLREDDRAFGDAAVQHDDRHHQTGDDPHVPSRSSCGHLAEDTTLGVSRAS